MLALQWEDWTAPRHSRCMDKQRYKPVAKRQVTRSMRARMDEPVAMPTVSNLLKVVTMTRNKNTHSSFITNAKRSRPAHSRREHGLPHVCPETETMPQKRIG